MLSRKRSREQELQDQQEQQEEEGASNLINVVDDDDDDVISSDGSSDTYDPQDVSDTCEGEPDLKKSKSISISKSQSKFKSIVDTLKAPSPVRPPPWKIFLSEDNIKRMLLGNKQKWRYNSNQHAMLNDIKMTFDCPPGLVTSCFLSGLGRSPKDGPSGENNTYEVTLQFGNIPDSVKERCPNMEAEHREFITAYKMAIAKLQRLMYDSDNFDVTGKRSAINLITDMRRNGSNGSNDTEDTDVDTYAFKQWQSNLRAPFIMEEDKEGVMSLKFSNRVMFTPTNRDDDRKGDYKTIGNERKSFDNHELQEYMDLVGPNGTHKRFDMSFFRPVHNGQGSVRIFKEDLEKDPLMEVIKPGDMISLNFGVRCYSPIALDGKSGIKHEPQFRAIIVYHQGIPEENMKLIHNAQPVPYDYGTSTDTFVANR